MDEIDRMDGATFELRLAALFRGRGHQTEVVGRRGDYGADLVLVKDGRKTVVQAKCWRNRKVGVKAVQEAVGARGHYGADDAIVVTNSYFTPNARNLARSNNITLWDRDALIQALLAAGSAPSAEVSTNSDTAIRTATQQGATSEEAFCARCGTPVSAKVRDSCQTHAQRFAGLIYCYQHQRSV